ncbi:MAG: glycosyltransferase family 2 protein [Bacteriovoracia bacterium]
MIDLSLVLPCYREEGHLRQNIDRVISLLCLSSLKWEVILVDDKSPDGTVAEINTILKKYEHLPVRGVFHQENQGRGGAFLTGAKESKGAIVGYFDIDLEVSPVYMTECIRKIIDENCDLVIGKRHYKVHLGLLYRHILSSAYSWTVSKILGIPRSFDSESGFKFFRRQALVAYFDCFIHKGWFWDTEVVTRFVRDGLRVTSTPVLFIRNATKRSTVKPIVDSLVYLKELILFRRNYRKLPRPRVIVENLKEHPRLSA